MLTLLKAYQKRLTNLTSSNKSLLLLTLPSEQFFDLHELDFLDNRPSFEIVCQLIAGKNKIALCDVLDSRYDKVNEATKRLRRIVRTASFIEQERGAQDLYVGYPMIHGKLIDGTSVRCPLLFFPVHLAQSGNRWELYPREGEEIQLNKSFLLAYSYFNNVKITDEWIETDFDDFSKDSLEFRTRLYELLKQSPLEINFNQDTFTDKLQPFQTFKRGDFEALQRNGEIKLYPEAVLGIFPQAGSYLMPDYQYLIEKNECKETEDFFLRKITEERKSKVSNEENLLTPLPLDASQEQAMQMVKSGKSVVVQGPPGTGKSQFIANLMADYAAQGKRVLLVCQKRVALDVVYERLRQVGITDFLALVHDFKQDRKALYEQINRQIERIEEYKRLNLSLDAIYLERNFTQECRRIDKLTQELEEFRKILFDETICGVSVKELYLTSSPDKPGVSLKKEYKHFRFGETDDFMRRLAAYESYLPLEAEFYPLHDRVSFHAFTYSDQDLLTEYLQEVPATAQSVLIQADRIANLKLSISDLEVLTEEERRMRQVFELIPDEPVWQIFLHYYKGNNAFVTSKWLDKQEKEILKCLKGIGIERSLSVDQLPHALELCMNALDARQNLFSWIRWSWFSGQKKEVQSIADDNGASLERSDLKKLVEKIKRRIAFEKVKENLAVAWNTENLYEPDLAKQWFENQRTARKAYKLSRKLASFYPLSSLLQGSYRVFQEKLYQLQAIADEWRQSKVRWRRYLTQEQVTRAWKNPLSIQDQLIALAEDFDALCELDKIKISFSSQEREVLTKIHAYYAALSKDDLSQNNLSGWAFLFDNSLRLSWIDHIEGQYPILRAVSTHKLKQMEDELQEALLKKQNLSREMLLMKLREQTYRNVEFNRLNNLVTYRDLKHQVSKKRHIWALRKLFAELGDEIFQLVPCWMASPESVSAIWDIHSSDVVSGEDNSVVAKARKTVFDLVIFDEASQCFAERGLPAMARGQQVVITGDSKQLQPNDLYQIRYEEDLEEVPDLEVNSLLDLASRYLPQTQLKGHYRSQSLELIDFSNRHFYQHNLELLPDFTLINKADPAIHYVKVDGIWNDSQNQEEADAVVTLVQKLVLQYPEKQIGVVTFNYKQQGLIQDKLESITIEHGWLLPDSLFVKNIENVQGDERDIIIFSLGYAPDSAGRLMMQFGSLNQQGGENRLNVAITRAKERIYVVSSLHPQQLRTDDVLHEGPRLLQKYLEYAWQVSVGEYVPKPKISDRFVSKKLLKDRIAEAQSEAVKELPFADITLKQEGRYEALILTDDDLYYQSLSAKEAHAYTPFLLTAKHWKFKRVYSREWWKKSGRLPKQ
ncbi:AAA domain-containing protein [Cytophagaceae bacterium DM2B3-1]|uniref:AAA domain-containing protein n=1 Tax=Xanthocytophaga flava TaxID=3048013 RepID=A0ABT7CF89_9BACT|nr:AAA domain-containing protein [Xanthocytophaga flavus]MDJ1491394.1 AAA domain-containing protein [Xanthocytophaga flavus]